MNFWDRSQAFISYSLSGLIATFGSFIWVFVWERDRERERDRNHKIRDQVWFGNLSSEIWIYIYYRSMLFISCLVNRKLERKRVSEEKRNSKTCRVRACVCVPTFVYEKTLMRKKDERNGWGREKVEMIGKRKERKIA